MRKGKLSLGIAALVLTTLVASACAGTTEVMSALEDKTWVLESYGEPGNLQTVLASTEITALFDSAEGQVHGSAGANSYFGGYHISKNKVSIQQIGHTEMYRLDPEGVMDQEQEYLTMLQAAESYEVQGKKLQVNCGRQILIFSERVE